MGKYDDIIDHPHHVSTVHPPMSLLDRAAQFSPFAALTGYDDAVRETARHVDRKIELDEDQKSAVDAALREAAGRTATVVYFVPDERKAGGRYETVTDAVRKVDAYTATLVMEHIRVRFDDIYSVELESSDGTPCIAH